VGAGEWTTVTLEPGVEFSVPADARRAGGIAVDSTAGLFEGDGYRIAFDLGRYGERLEELPREDGFTSRLRRFGGHEATEVAFVPSDESAAWARILQRGVGAGRTLTIRVSCDSEELCAIADAIFDSVRVEEPR
jgi:hypothetical protein